jgi:mannitol/fructose-specific phosphotransferase system IIA component
MGPALSIDPDVLTADAIQLGRTAAGRDDAITQCGRALIGLGAVEEPYLDAMHERERQISTYIGAGVAIPHGVDQARRHIRRTALAVLQFPDGVDWDGEDVRLCVAIAAKGDEHVPVLAALARLLQDERVAAELRSAAEVSTVLNLLFGRSTKEESA